MGNPNLDVEEKRVELGDVDAALEYLNHEDTTLMTEVDEKKLLRKIDWMIVPLLWLCYCLQYLDKTLSMALLPPPRLAMACPSGSNADASA